MAVLLLPASDSVSLSEVPSAAFSVPASVDVSFFSVCAVAFSVLFFVSVSDSSRLLFLHEFRLLGSQFPDLFLKSSLLHSGAFHQIGNSPQQKHNDYNV